MNCTTVEVRLSAFLDGELTGSEMLAVREHLRHCPRCSSEAESLRALKSLIVCAPEPEPSKEFESRLVSHVFAHADPARRRTRAAVPVAMLALALVVALAAIVLRPSLVEEEAGGLDANRAAPYDLEMENDQAFSAGMDPLRSRPPLISTSYGRK